MAEQQQRFLVRQPLSSNSSQRYLAMSMKRLINTFVFCLLLTGLYACGNKTSNNGVDNLNDSTIKSAWQVKGVAAKGLLDTATINIYMLDANGDKSGAPVASTTTDSSGVWTVSFGTAPTTLLLVESIGGQFIDESDPTAIMANKRRIALSATDTLEGLLFPGESTAALTVVTNALIRKSRAESLNSDFTAAVDFNRNTAISALGFDPFVTLPTNPVFPAPTSPVSEKSYALLVGGLAYAMHEAAIALGLPMMDFEIIGGMIADLSDGTLNGQNSSGVVMVDINSVPTAFPASIDLSAQIVRFRNNYFVHYRTFTPIYNLSLLSQTYVSVPVVGNNAPVATPDNVTTTENIYQNFDLLGNDTDIDGDALVLSSVTFPENGAVEINGNGSVTYYPKFKFVGTDSFMYTISDGTDTSSAVVTVTVDADSDDDRISDNVEIAASLNPDNPDTDGDGYSDREETGAGTDPTLVNDHPVSNTIVSTNISTDTVWTYANSPYIVTNTIDVDTNATLTIEAGVVVKFYPDIEINILSGSTLNVNGQSDWHVIFTSINDNSVGGITGSTAPSGVDWLGLDILNGSMGNITGLTVKHADRAIWVGDSAVLTDVKVNQSGDGIRVNRGSPILKYLNISINGTTDDAISILAPSSPTIQYFQIDMPSDATNNYGIFIEDTEPAVPLGVPTVSDGEIYGNNRCSNGIYLNDSGAGAVYQVNVSRIKIFDCDFGVNSNIVNGTFDSLVINGNDQGVFLNNVTDITVKDTVIVNGSRGVSANGSNIRLIHNLIRGNRGSYNTGGIDAISGVTAYNNLIIQNETSSGAGGVYLSGSPSNVFRHNTITENAVDDGSPGGVFDATLETTFTDNIVWGNYNSLSTVTASSDMSRAVAGTNNHSNNLIGVLDAGVAGTDIIGGNPAFVENWYINSALSDADDNGSGPVGNFSYLSEYITTDPGGTADAGVADIGFHHDGAARVVSSATTEFYVSSTSLAGGESTTITVIPRQADFSRAGPGLDIGIAFSDAQDGSIGSPNGLQLDYVKDIGFGSYTFTFTAPISVSAGSDSVRPLINGVDVGVPDIIISWTGDVAPTAVNDTATTTQNVSVTTIDLTLNDTDPQLDVLIASFYSSPSSGNVIDNGDNTFTYVPNPSFSGVDTFDYLVSDGSNTDIGTVTITVDPDADGDGLIDSAENGSGTFNNINDTGSLANNPDSDGDGFTDYHEALVGNDPNNGSDFPATVTSVSADIPTSTWTLANSPYRVTTNVNVQAGATLTIEAGVVVKFDSPSALIVPDTATLLVQGNAPEPQNVTFTSVHNDTIAGDTDAIVQAPSFVDWNGLQYRLGSAGSVKNANISYANVGLEVTRSSPNFDNLQINETGVGVYVATDNVGAPVSSVFNNMVITNPGSAGIQVQSGVSATVDATFNNTVINNSGDIGLEIYTFTDGEIATTFNNVAINEVQNIGVFIENRDESSNPQFNVNFTGQNSVIDTLGNCTSAAIKVRGNTQGVSPLQVSNFTTDGCASGLSLDTTATGTFSNNLFRHARDSGIYLNSTGINLTLSGNIIVNNDSTGDGGGIAIINTDSSAVIEHNLIRSNFANNIGGGIYVLTGNNPTIRNNLIAENEAVGAGGGIYIDDGASVTLRHNTVTANFSQAPLAGAGIFVNTTGTLSIVDSLIMDNFANYPVGITRIETEFIGTVTDDFNISHTSATGFSGANHIAYNPGGSGPILIASWYQPAVSVGIDNGSGAVPAYLTDLGIPTVLTSGVIDLNTTDIGYHHASAAPIIDAVNSTVTPSNIVTTADTPTVITITPIDINTTQSAGPGVRVSLSLTNSTSIVDRVIDEGDGTYSFNLTAGTGTGNDTVTVTVNGVTLSTTVDISWTP